MDRTQGVAVVNKALDVLESLLAFPNQTVAEVSQAAKITKAAAYRILSTLEKRGYVATYERVRRYSIGHAFHAYVRAAGEADRLIEMARPAMRSLREHFGETINLGVLARGGVLYVEIMESDQALRATSEVGSFDALHSTALGKAIMSRLPAADRDALLAVAKLVPRTKYTKTNAESLRAAIDLAAKLGRAVDDEENEIGMRCVAAPIVNADGWPLAAISVSGPSSRMSLAAIDRIGERLAASCADVSRALALSDSRAAQTNTGRQSTGTTGG